MSHLSLTVNLSDSFVNHIQTYKTENFLKREVVARAAYLGSIPVFCVTAALDLILCVGAAIGATLTLGFYKPLVERAALHLFGFSWILPLFLASVACAVNPNTSFNALEISKKLRSHVRDVRLKMPKDEQEPAEVSQAPHLSKVKKFVCKHVIMRGVLIVVLPVLCVAAVARGIFGIACASLSICTAGRFENLNKYAVSICGRSNLLEVLTLPLLMPAVIMNPKSVLWMMSEKVSPRPSRRGLFYPWIASPSA